MNRSVTLDLVRFFAVGAIVSVHVLQTIGGRFSGFFGVQGLYYVSIGGAAVTVLIVLSGLVIRLQYRVQLTSYWSFLLKRFLRLYPSYYLILAIGLAAYFLRGFFGVEPHAALTLMDIPLSFSAMYAFVGQWGGPFVGTSWFLGVIVSLYALFPFIEPLFHRKPHTTLIILLVVSVSFRLLLGQFDLLPRRPLDWFPLSRVFEFGLGIYLAGIIPTRFWKLLNGKRTIGRTSLYISELSFPLFLVHWPILHTLKHVPVPDFAWIILFLVVSIAVSACILEIDRRIFTPFIHNKIIF